MDLQLNFVKSDNEVWGFRLKGGAEYDLPFLVVHVAEDSIAEQGGLRCNDVIVSVNDTPTDRLVHQETHALLASGGNNLLLGIRRGMIDLISPLTCINESNEEICNIMQAYIQDDEEFEHQRQVDFEIINPTGENTTVEARTDVTLQLPAEDHFSLTAGPLRENLMTGVKDRKWSSFLQKPNNAVPVLKVQEDGPKAEPYRVIIKKQKRRTPEELKNKKLQAMKSEEEASDLGQIAESVEEDGQGSTVSQEEENSHKEENDAEREVEDEIEEKLEEETEVDEEMEAACSEENNIGEEELSKDEEEKEDDAELQKFLGEKLAEVQKQLEALSKLPSTMQLTIDSLNKQLASLVVIANPVNEEEEQNPSRGNSESGDDAAEQMITEDENEEENLEVDKESEPEGEIERPLEQEEDEGVDEDPDREPELTEQEVEAMRMEQELLEKQQKEQELLEEFQQRRLKHKPTLPLRPIQRPIILPGGRRWSQPDDAVPVVKRKKMSDEKIANTLETYAEVITGRTKGINFQKYTPPAKNLDYLQRSDVYKLIHDLDSPVRGICSRASKILAEQDYYPTG